MNICLGGEHDPLTLETQIILQRAIRSGLRIHSCYFYGNSLESIAAAAQAIGIEPSLTLKLYFPCDTRWLNLPVPTQLEQIKARLKGFTFARVDFQLCGNPAVEFFTKPKYGFEAFLNSTLRREFPKARLMVESFIEWSANVEKLIGLDVIDGLIFFNNSVTREVGDRTFTRLRAAGNKCLAGMRMMAGGDKPTNDLGLIPERHRAAWQRLFQESDASTFIDYNIMYAKAANYLDYNVLSVSSLRHLDEVIEKADALPSLDRDLFDSLETLKGEIWRGGGTLSPYFTQADPDPLRESARLMKRAARKTAKWALDRAMGKTNSPWVA